jgi:uncharacterized protein YndB with AHSA1/START domain
MIKELTVKKTIEIKADKLYVWDALINPEKIKQYFFGINVISNWKVGNPILFQYEMGGKEFKDKGNILAIEPGRLLQYNYWSSYSGLGDKEENYSIVTYKLDPKEDGTTLTLTQQGFANDQAKEHSENSWAMVLKNMKELIEKKITTAR